MAFREFESLLALHCSKGAAMLSKMLAYDFGEKIGHFPTLVDPNNNQFKVLVEKINGCMFLNT
uniref:Uncharacterized protein n=1 Tax=Solanum lycopersicum TaxID=4081 RepID=A0A494G8U6_SOLLC